MLDEDQLELHGFGQTFTIKKSKKSHSIRKKRKQLDEPFANYNSPL